MQGATGSLGETSRLNSEDRKCTKNQYYNLNFGEKKFRCLVSTDILMLCIKLLEFSEGLCTNLLNLFSVYVHFVEMVEISPELA